MDDLTACFPRPAAFSSHSNLVRPDIFLRLPPAANFAGEALACPDFVSHTPAAAMAALLTTRAEPSNTAPLVETPSRQALSKLTFISPSIVRPIMATPHNLRPISWP